MKSLLIATAVLAALPALAEEPADKPSAPAAQTTTVAKPESPLAAAARKSKRNDGKKRVIITNESLKESKGGHMSTSDTNIQLPIVKALPPAKTEKELIQEKADQKAAEAKRVAAEQKAKDAEQKKLERMARASEMAEGEEAGYGEHDPAQMEKELEDASKPNP